MTTGRPGASWGILLWGQLLRGADGEPHRFAAPSAARRAVQELVPPCFRRSATIVSLVAALEST